MKNETSNIVLRSFITGRSLLQLHTVKVGKKAKNLRPVNRNTLHPLVPYTLTSPHPRQTPDRPKYKLLPHIRTEELWKVQTIPPVANTNRTRTQRIRRFSGKVFWTERRRNPYSVHYGKRVQFEKLHYGVLVMVLCDEDGVVYDIRFTCGSMHEAEAYRVRKAESVWFRHLVESAKVYGDRGYEGVEGVLGCVKSFNAISRCRKRITLLAYVCGYSIAYSFLRGELRHE